MVNTLLSVRVPKNLEADCREIVQLGGYTSTQELVREALREKVLAFRRSVALTQIRKLKGSQTGVIASKKELSDLARKKYL